MKKYRIIILALAAGLCLASCDSFFDINTKDQATMEDIMSRSTAVRQYLAHLYNYIPNDENLRANEGGTSLRSDEALHGKSQWETNWYKVRRGEYSSASSTDVSTGNIWKKYYEGINECATFIKYLPYDKEDSPALVNAMEGEARFLRAYYYFCLFRHYGPVFLWQDENGDPIESDTSISGEEIDRNTVDENVTLMVKELDKAISLLPADISAVTAEYSNMGRVTKGAAMALKSRVLLYAASPLYNGNTIPDFANLKNHKGDLLFPAYDATKWDKAYQAAKDIINLKKYELTKKGNPLTSIQDAANSYQNVWFENWETNKEIIWGWWYRTWAEDYLGSIGGEIAFSAPSGGKLCRRGFSLITPSLKLIDAYPMAETGRYPVVGYEETAGMIDLSRPIVDAVSGYVADDWVDDYQQVVDVSKTWATPIKAHSSTVGRDARFYSNFVPNGFWWPCQRPMGGNSSLLFTCWNDPNCTSPYSSTEGCNRVGYVWRRLYKAGNQLKEDTDYSSIRYIFPAFRLAEVYLTYAEACNEMTARDADEAIKYVDLVRARSGLVGLKTAYPEIDFSGAGGTIGGITRTGQEWLRWMIRQEKMCEFAFEGSQRHYDAIRTLIAEKEYNMDNWTLHVTADNYEDSYQRVSNDYIGGRSVFHKRDYLFPFGSYQLSEMTNFTQNPGW